MLPAEGVEMQEQQDLLLDCGCKNFQGYLLENPRQLKSLMKS